MRLSAHWSLSIDWNGLHGIEHDSLEVVTRREVLLQRGKGSIPLGLLKIEQYWPTIRRRRCGAGIGVGGIGEARCLKQSRLASRCF